MSNAHTHTAKKTALFAAAIALTATLFANLFIQRAQATTFHTISVNFEGLLDEPVTGEAGINQADNWNNVENGDTSFTGVVDSFGDPTGVSIALSSGGGWRAVDPAPGGGTDASMMNGYLNDFDGFTFAAGKPSTRMIGS